MCLVSHSSMAFCKGLGVEGWGGSTSPRLGKALLAFYEKTCEIVRGENVVTENVIDREADPRVFKLTLYGALMRAYLYMAEKNSFACARLICGSTH